MVFDSLIELLIDEHSTAVASHAIVGSTNLCGFRDQNSHRFRDQGSNFWAKIWDQSRKNIPRYDPVRIVFSCWLS